MSSELFTSESCFDPETVRAMSVAYDRAMNLLPKTQQQHLLLQDTIARRIIAFAARGERDPDRLYARAVELLSTFATG